MNDIFLRLACDALSILGLIIFSFGVMGGVGFIKSALIGFIVVMVSLMISIFVISLAFLINFAITGRVG